MHGFVALFELYLLWKNGDGSRFLGGVRLDQTLVTMRFFQDSWQFWPGQLLERTFFIYMLMHGFVALDELYLLWKNGDGSQLLGGVPLDNTYVTRRVFNELSTVETRTTTPAQHFYLHVRVCFDSSHWALSTVKNWRWFTAPWWSFPGQYFGNR